MQPDSVENEAVDLIFIPPDTTLMALQDDGIQTPDRLDSAPVAVSVKLTSLKHFTTIE